MVRRHEPTPGRRTSRTGRVDECQERIDGACSEAVADRRAGFDGDFVFEVREMPVDDFEAEAMPGSLAAERNWYVTGAGGEHVGHAVECRRAAAGIHVSGSSAGGETASRGETYRPVTRRGNGVGGTGPSTPRAATFVPGFRYS